MIGDHSILKWPLLAATSRTGTCHEEAACVETVLFREFLFVWLVGWLFFGVIFFCKKKKKIGLRSIWKFYIF